MDGYFTETVQEESYEHLRWFLTKNVTPLINNLRLENNAVLEKYQAIWETYKTKYESNENAKELAKIKRDTMQEKEQCELLFNFKYL